MTTINFRAARDTSDVPSHAGNVIEAYTGTRHDQKKYRIQVDEDLDEDLDRLTVDFAPDIKEIHRSGTRGAGRGTMRGAR